MIGAILNPRSGYVATHGPDNVVAAIQGVLPDAHVHVLAKGDDIGDLCQDYVASGARCIIAGGGDGTVNAVAARLVHTDVALGVLPVGTLNHFARDVGVGRDVGHALRVLAAGYTLPVDVASVNGHIFVNNSSIGMYVEMVEVRRRYERRLGKWRALCFAAWLAARHAHSSVVEIDTDRLASRVHTYLVFVGNNQYELNLLHLGQRAALDAGELCCFVLEAPNRLSLVPHLFHYLRDHRADHHVVRTMVTDALTVIPARHSQVDVACDGEVCRMAVPLVYRVLPRALRVVVPKPPPADSREVRDRETEADSASSVVVTTTKR